MEETPSPTRVEKERLINQGDSVSDNAEIEEQFYGSKSKTHEDLRSSGRLGKAVSIEWVRVYFGSKIVLFSNKYKEIRLRRCRQVSEFCESLVPPVDLSKPSFEKDLSTPRYSPSWSFALVPVPWPFPTYITWMVTIWARSSSFLAPPFLRSQATWSPIAATRREARAMRRSPWQLTARQCRQPRVFAWSSAIWVSSSHISS